MERGYQILYDGTLDGAELAPRRFKQPGDCHSQLNESCFLLKNILEKTELPELIRAHPFYALLKKRLTGGKKGEIQKKRRNQARFIPEHKNETLVQESIAEFADLVMQTIETEGDPPFSAEIRGKAVNGIRKSINYLLRENLEKIAAAPLFHFGKRRVARGEEVFRSRNQIKAAVVKVKARVDEGRLDKDKALIAVLHELGGLSAAEIRRRSRKGNGANGEDFDVQHYDTDEIEEDILESIKWASEYGGRKTEWINKLINRYLAEESLVGTFDRPSFNENLRLEDAFDLLVKFFLTEETDYRDGNDIQLILNDALLHWTWKRTFSSRERKEYRAVEQSVLGTLCVKKDERFEVHADTGPVLRYRKDATGRWRFEVISNAHERQQLYTLKPLHCPRGMSIRLYSYQMGEKSPEAGIEKHLDDDQGQLIPSEVSDFFRTRFMLWKITSKQLRENAVLQAKITETLRKLGERICGDSGSAYEVVEAKPGDKFIKWQLKGKTQTGLPVEIQFIPHDTYLFEHADASPIAHEVFEEERSIKRWRVKVPPSISPIMHKAFDLREPELRAERAAAKKAMDEFDYAVLEEAFRATAPGA